MKSRRPFSSNPFKKGKIKKKLLLMNSLNNSNDIFKKLPSFSINSNNVNKTLIERPQTSLFQINKKNIFSRNISDNLDVLNLIIETNPNQYNLKKINKKIISINPMFKKGTEENLKRPPFDRNTEEVFYKYNLLYGSNTTNLIRTYSPKMRPMSASINGFNKKMNQNWGEKLFVFNYEEIVELMKAKCKDIGIDLRDNMISKFNDFCNSKCKNRVVDLSDCYLGIHSIKFLSNILYNSDRIAILNLTKNNLGDYGIEILVNSIKKSLSLLSLNITSNSITHKGGQIIFEELCEQQSIIDLNISSIEGTNRNRLTATGIKNIPTFLKKNLFIEKLNLGGNSIKNEGFILLSKGLNNNNNIINLNISNNDIHSKGLTKGLNLITNCKIYSLNLSNNPILDEGIEKLTESTKNFPNLHKLNVSNCGFEFHGFELLMNSLQFNKRIEYLDVSGNNIRSSNYERLKPCFETFGVRYLNMSKCSLGNESAYYLGECIKGNETIKYLNISQNKISDIGFKSYVNLFSTNNSIEVFDCSVNFISDLTAKDFIKNMKFNRSLKKINFFDNQLKNEMGNLFIEILEANKNLVNINLGYNRVQMKTIDDINRNLKLNNEKQKTKFIPNILKELKNLQFNPEMFGFYTQNIQNKREQQKILYKKVKLDNKNFNKLIKKENRKIEIKAQEINNIKKEIIEYQMKIKEIKDNFDKIQTEMIIYEGEMNDKIDEEIKKLKVFKDKNDMLMAEYRATKKDLEGIIEETKAKQKISQDKLDLAKKSFQYMTREIKRKNELFSKMNNPDMLVPINDLKNEEIRDKDKTKKNNKLLRKISINYNINSNVNTESNITRSNILASENRITTTSSSIENKKGNNIKNIKKTFFKENN